MGAPYQSQSASGYNSSPPPDDGSTVPANKITWAGIKAKLADPIKTLSDAINSTLRSALSVTPSTTSITYTTLTSDHLTTVEATGTISIHLGSAVSMIAQAIGYTVSIYNKGTGVATVDLATATDTLNGHVNGVMTLNSGQSMTFTVAQSGVGYDIVSASGFEAVDLSGEAGTNTATAAAPTKMIGLYSGQLLIWTPAATNTGSLTLNITPSGGSALGAKNVFAAGAACVGGEAVIGVPAILEYDGTQLNIVGYININALTADASPDGAADYVQTYDASALGSKKVLVNALGKGWVLLSTGTASNSATLDFTGLTGYSFYAFVLSHIVPATDTAVPYMRVSVDNGSNYKTGASDYRWAHFGTNDSATNGSNGDVADSEIEISVGVSNDTTYAGISGLILSDDLSTAKYHSFTVDLTTHDSGSGADSRRAGMGRYISTAAAVNAIRFLFSSGNITSGSIKCYGLR